MSEKILVVDDEEINRDILKDCLKNQFEVDTAENGLQALEKIEKDKNRYAIMLLDLQMPVMNGFEVLEALKEKKIEDIYVLIITVDKTMETEKKCYDLGAKEFIEKPFHPYSIQKKVENLVNMKVSQQYLREKIKEQTDILQKQNKIIKIQNKHLKEINSAIIDAMGSIVEYRHLESSEHIKRVKRFTRCLAEYVRKEYPEYGLDENMVSLIAEASPLHDLGKIAIPDKILQKPGKLTDLEFDYIKSHTVRGCSILENMYALWDADLKKICYEICKYHHERYDGKGYPEGLVGDEIPISAQIVSVADAYDTLLSDRVYKSAYPREKAFNMIINGECGVFSPYIMESFRHAKNDLEKIIDDSSESEK